MSFLRSEGHVDAGQYPIWRVSLEEDLAADRVEGRIRQNAVLMQVSVAAHKGKKQFKAFKETLENM